MLAKTTLLLLGATAAGINAAHIADSWPRDLGARSANAAGGWPLGAESSTYSCPSGNPVCNSFTCCPSSLACVSAGSEDFVAACCPTNADCSATFLDAPSCADSSWNLWNATFVTNYKHAYFCCLPGQVGLQNGLCANSDSADVTGKPNAILVGAPKTTTSVSFTFTAATTTVVAVTTSTTGTATLSETTVGSSANVTSGISNGISTSTSTSTSISTISKASTSAPTTSVAQTTAAATPSSVSAASSAAATSTAAVVGKSEAVSFNRVGGLSLAAVVATAFALVLL